MEPPGPFESLADHLGSEADDKVVATLVGFSDGHETHLVAGSILVGPPLMAELSWPKWMAAQGHDVPAELLACADLSVDRPEFTHRDGPWVITRIVLKTDSATRWLEDVISAGRIDEWCVGTRVLMSARLGAATDLAVVSPHAETAGSRLCAASGRPVRGWIHPLETDPEVPRRGSGVDVPELRGAAHFFDVSTLVGGINRFGDDGVPGALLVGRLSRTAWIGSVRGSSGMTSLRVRVLLDPATVSFWELEIEVEEYSRGELVYARRTPLEMFRLPPHGTTEVALELPILGPRIQRRVRLWDRGGSLLDWTSIMSFVESMVLSVGLLDDPGARPLSTRWIGDRSGPLLAPDRLVAIGRVEREYRESIEAGSAQRQLLAPSQAEQLVTERLGVARGAISICDPYFGSTHTDFGWRLLRTVSLPTRVLTKSSATKPSGLGHVEMRRVVGTPEFHDRLYLWDGGGLAIGTSTSGLGKRFALVQNLFPQDVDGLKARFDDWWAAAKVVQAGDDLEVS